ncbi:MAG: HD domain-containing protein, partial [Clostridia bacterium]|nr:HD domain-containing protein [Clostridia bacterium]
MRLIGMNSLKAGDVLAMPVCTLAGKVILNAGVEITDAYVEKLKQIRINTLYIEDDRFSDVEFVQALDFKTMNRALQVIRDTYEAVQKNKPFDEYLMQEVSKSIVDYIRENKDKGVSILANAVDDYITGHSLNVAILTALMGNKMNFNFNQLCDLVTGALIHDLGRENSQEECPEHTQRGFDIMRKCRGFNLHSSIVCYEHHENFNGTGYPRKIKGTAISEYTRVIRAADMYDTIL